MLSSVSNAQADKHVARECKKADFSGRFYRCGNEHYKTKDCQEKKSVELAKRLDTERTQINAPSLEKITKQKKKEKQE